MSGQAVIDSLEFARTGQVLRSGLAIRGLSRLQDSLFDGRGEIEYEVRGGHDAHRRPVLALEISGTLHLRCQCCLGILNYPLRIANTLLLASAGEAAAGGYDEEDADWIEASGELDVASLVEDEIILSLPYAPRHEEGQCQRDTRVTTDGSSASVFAAFAALKRNGN